VSEGRLPDLPDLTAFPLEEAVRLLQSQGLSWSIHETKAPTRGVKSEKDDTQTVFMGKLRVIRVRFGDALDCVELTVCSF
jgi:hypothetical protein